MPSCIPFNPCPLGYIDAHCVVYEGSNIPHLAVQTNDRVDDIFQKISLAIKDITLVPGTNITISRSGDTYTISASAVGVGDSSTSEVFIVQGNFSKAFSAGTVLISFILDTPSDTYVSVGTIPGGEDIVSQYGVSATQPPMFENAQYFKNSQTWYFTGIPAGTLVAIFYRPPVINPSNQ